MQGGHRTDAERLLQVCPHLKRRGKCSAHNKELRLRREVAAAKEKELIEKATAMYGLQLDLLASTTEETGGDLAEAQALLRGLSARGAFSPEPQKKKEMINRLVDELKQEPAYQHWNLEAELAAVMVHEKVRHCPFSHHEESHLVLKRDRAAAARLDAQAGDQLWKQLRREGGAASPASTATATATAATAAVVPMTPRRVDQAAAARARWSRERTRVFAQLTPFQKCVCGLLWQRTVHVPQRLLRDVRRWLEQRAAAHGTWPGHTPATTREADSDEDGALEAYLESPEFDARVEAEEARVIAHTVCRPELGVLDLSALPSLVVYASEKTGAKLFSAATVQYFTAEEGATKDEGEGGQGQPRATTAAKPSARAFVPSKLTSKEVDVSQTGKADELAEALEWMGLVFSHEHRLGLQERGEKTARASEVAMVGGRFVWRSLALRRAELTQAEALVTALHKRGVSRQLLALDLSDNRLTSMRFLFYLRANYGHRLLRLSLRNNLITRKPEYQEQVRLSLPRLTSLDGEPIRRPPMPFPRPRPDSFTLSVATPAQSASTASIAASPSAARSILASGTTEAEARTVLDCLARLCYIWETRRIPHTQAELTRYAGGRAVLEGDADGEQPRRGGGRASKVGSHIRTLAKVEKEGGASATSPTAGAAASSTLAREPAAEVTEPEQELDEDNFPHRYLHPSATYSFTASPDLVLFEPSIMKLNREVELDDSYEGMRLNHDDVRAVRVFDVAVRNSSRNLLQGRPALQRTVRGAASCYLAYQLTLYPDTLSVDHHLGSAVISILKVKDTRGQPAAQSAAAAAAAAAAKFGGGAAQGPQPTFYLVTVHGVLTWRAPSMHGTELLTAAYDRTVTFVEKVFTAQNREWERLRSPKLVVFNDHIHVRPHQLGSPLCYTPSTFARLARLVVEFGLEACTDGVELVRCVMEQARTDAAEHAALDALVFGPPPPLPPLTDDEAEAATSRRQKERAGKLLPCTFDRASAEASQLAVARLMQMWIARTTGREASEALAVAEAAGPVFRVASLLDRTAGMTTEAHEDAAQARPRPLRHSAAGQGESTEGWGGSHLHTVPLAMVREVVAMCNTHYAALKLC